LRNFARDKARDWAEQCGSNIAAVLLTPLFGRLNFGSKILANDCMQQILETARKELIETLSRANKNEPNRLAELVQRPLVQRRRASTPASSGHEEFIAPRVCVLHAQPESVAAGERRFLFPLKSVLFIDFEEAQERFFRTARPFHNEVECYRRARPCELRRLVAFAQELAFLALLKS
jgi:hypothetical protein